MCICVCLCFSSYCIVCYLDFSILSQSCYLLLLFDICFLIGQICAERGVQSCFEEEKEKGPEEEERKQAREVSHCHSYYWALTYCWSCVSTGVCDRLLDWKERIADGPMRKKNERIIVFRNVFDPKEFDVRCRHCASPW